MNQLKVFNFKENEVRTVLINNEPYFVGKDVAEILGYQNSSKALSDHVDEEDKLNNESLSSLGQRGGWLINESGMYSLVLSSKLPQAKEFKRWVTKYVLPTIRKTGGYQTLPMTYKEALLQLVVQVETNEQLQLENKMKDQQINELKPKADYYDEILRNKGLVTITQIAKDYGMSGVSFNRLLHQFGIQYKQSGQWLLYYQFQNNGYTHSETVEITHSDGRPDVKMNTKWTQKGRLFLYEFLKAKNVIPVIEKGS